MGKATMTLKKDVDYVSLKMLTEHSGRDQGGTYRSSTYNLIKQS